MSSWRPDQNVVISQDVLSKLMPLHIFIDQEGKFLSAGAIAQKFLPENITDISQALEMLRPASGTTLVQYLHQAAQTGERIEMRLRHAIRIKLRGLVVLTETNHFLLNLGFGMFLHEAVSKLGINDADFPPSSQAMEYMFLYEANRGVMRELSLFNERLNNAYAEAEEQAYTDALTGVQNRRGLLLKLRRALVDIASPGGKAHIAIAQVDLDHFKLVNDRFGHAAGDIVLCHVARVLRHSIRAEDTVARVGGDEFVLVLRDVDDLKSLQDLGQRIIKEIEKPFEFSGEICQISVSIGIVMVKATDDLQIERILADADTALYASKREGRARTTIVTMSGPIDKKAS